MKLHRLRVSNFASLRNLDVEFGPGLNVLYGPNDLGKSTLVEAIRMALLLPTTAASSFEPFVEWSGGCDPVVELTFETASQRIWRVRKEYAKRGVSLLQQSKNGQDFEDVERARAVDGKLREILCWGIPEPGGAGAGKGLPSSFIATALLSTQSNVTAMLESSLATDLAGTGKEKIATALQAVAADPLFIALLKNVQERRDEAFTPGGGKKTSRGSAFKVVADRVRETKEERDRLQQTVDDSESTEKELQSLIQKRTEQLEALAEATTRVSTLERLEKEAAAIHAADEQIKVAQDSVDRIVGLQGEIDSAQKRAQSLANAEAGAKERLTNAQVEYDQSQTLLKVEEEKASAEGSDANDIVVRQQLELQISVSEQAALNAQHQIDAIKAVQALVDDAANAERQYLGQQSVTHKAKVAAEQSAAAVEAGQQGVDRCELILKALDVRASNDEVTRAQAAVAEYDALEARLKTAREKHSELLKQRTSLIVPASSVLPPLRQLDTELAAARATLSVGLVVTVTPRRPVEIDIRKDGNASVASGVTPFDVEATSEIDVNIKDVAIIQIRGGKREAQQNVRKLEERWNKEVAPHLARAGAANLSELDAKVQEALEIDAKIKTYETEVRSCESQLKTLQTAKAFLDAALVRRDSCISRMGDVSLDALLPEIKKLGSDPFEVLHQKKSTSVRAIEALRAEATAKSVQLAQAEERETHLKNLRDVAIDKRDGAAPAFAQGIAKALADEEMTLAAISKEMQSRKSELASLDETIARRKAHVDEVLAAARAGSMRSKSTVESAQTELTKAVAACAELAGQITELRKRREAEDLPAAQVRLLDAKGQRAALPVPERIINTEEITAAKHEVTTLRAELERLDRDLHKTQGALELVGGAVARERLRDAKEAFDRALQRERETEADYEAWKLLLEQMKLADADQASNLGLTLAPAIAERFQALTNQRYETIQLDASLATEGVLVEGTLRDSDRMSVGTREQLSTLYRLCLAEYLQTVVVLDDQLVQSDENRMDWFRSLLTDKGKLFQIVVFTCRPRDYLEKGAIVPKGKSQFLDSSDGSIRAIDLGKLISRSRSTSA